MKHSPTPSQRPLPKGFNCETCGKWHDFSMYVYAHTTVTLKHKCDCGAEHKIINLTAEQTKKGKKS